MAVIQGQITLNEIALAEVDIDPSTAGGLDLPIGSMAFLGDQASARVWLKNGSGVTDWTRVTVQAAGSELTAGSVPFVGSGGLLTQNNAQLFWDATNNRLGIGTNAPAVKLHQDGGNATATYHKFTAGTTTGTTASDGFDVGIGAIGDAELRQRENLGIRFYTSDTLRCILSAAGVFSVFNSTDTAFMRVTPGWFGGSTGTWIDLDTSGPSGIGTGGPGVNPFFAYVGGVGQWMTDSVAADVAYRNTSGRLLFGTSASDADLIITSAGDALFRDTVYVGAATPVASAKLQIDSTTQGFLRPRMTTAQMNAIASPATGLTVYNTDLNTECVYDGTAWLFELAIINESIQSTTSNAYADVTQLVTPSLPIGRYVFEFTGVMQSTAIGTGVGIRLGESGAVTSQVVANWAISQAGNGTDKNFEYSQLSATTNITSASVTTANADFPVRGSGVMTITTAGAVAAQIRTEGGGISISIRPNSVLVIKKISN